jgi:RNA-splicing ligase RtcB
MESESTVITGSETEAIVYLPEELIEENAYEQVERIVNNPAFQGDVRIMSDMHWGPGCIIGFTMPVTDRVVPNTVGFDIGCGVLSFKLTDFEYSLDNTADLQDLDAQIRDVIPLGHQTHSEPVYHIGDNFPWEKFKQNWSQFSSKYLESINSETYHPEQFSPDVSYFKDLCSRIGYRVNNGITAMGTLGGGNHFIEMGTDSSGDVWCTIHSGSRKLGKKIGSYHQERAKQLRYSEAARKHFNSLPERYTKYLKFDLETVSDSDLLEWLQGGKGESFIDSTQIQLESSAEQSEVEAELKQAIPAKQNIDDELTYLEGDEATEYYVDLAFGQLYASESRRCMAQLIAEKLDAEIKTTIESVHNYIDYTDGIIRKGATPAREGEDVVIPLNMSSGTLLAVGKGNPDWNYSVCHGAGRIMSRTEARNTISREKHQEKMGETIATELPQEEAPQAYKEDELIKSMIQPTVTITEHIEPKLSIKAPD